MDFESLERNTRKLSNADNIYKLMIEASEKFEAEIIDLNTGQLSEGLLSTGKKLDKYESSEYAKFKKAIGSKSSPVADLKLEGDFYGGFDVKFKTTSFEIDSSDAKAGKLENKYSSDIYGLTEKSVEDLMEQGLSDDIVKKINDELTK